LPHVETDVGIEPGLITLVGQTKVREPVPSWQILIAISCPKVALVVTRVDEDTLPVSVIAKF